MSRPQRHRERDIDRLLIQPGAKEDLDKLCAAGCDRDGLVRILMAASTVISFNRSPNRRRPNRRPTFPSGKEVTKLSTDIEQLATRIERTNADPIVSPAVVLDALTKPRSLGIDRDYKRQVCFFHALPDLLRAYAGELRKSYKFAQRTVGPKRFSLERHLVQKLLEYVQAQTGQPHYEPVQRLLEIAFRVTADEETLVPKLLGSPDALKQLWTRSLQYGLRKKKPDTSHPILKPKL